MPFFQLTQVWRTKWRALLGPRAPPTERSSSNHHQWWWIEPNSTMMAGKMRHDAFGMTPASRTWLLACLIAMSGVVEAAKIYWVPFPGSISHYMLAAKIGKELVARGHEVRFRTQLVHAALCLQPFVAEALRLHYQHVQSCFLSRNCHHARVTALPPSCTSPISSSYWPQKKLSGQSGCAGDYRQQRL